MNHLQSIVDTRLVTEVDVFDGKPENWKSFSWRFTNAVSSIGLDDAMRAARQVDESDVRMESLTDPQQKIMCKSLFILLSQKCRGRAEVLLRAAGPSQGFVAWQRLKAE